MQEVNKAFEILAEKARISAELERLAAQREELKIITKMFFYQELTSDISIEMSLEEISADNGNTLEADKVNSPAFKFKEEMLAAIKKRKEELKKGINDPWLEKARANAIEAIERNLRGKNLKVEELDEKYHNYRKNLTV
ncbi:6952_t:CDS:2 [Ambispora leptoticha]|uniref:6952_t:CDS:1 n=1 Tax=Ambispora leptoticha TaxID=144679 RepID=A0A9N8V4R5_9GLOM|nr:6952_t:CDS:2 [Ambispora leptoticha]